MSRRKPTRFLRVRLDFTVELAQEIDDLPRLTLGVLDGAAMAVHKHLPDSLRTGADEIAIMSGAKLQLTLDGRKLTKL